MDTTSKCIRQVENWSVMKDYHKMDNPNFNPNKLRIELPVISPKIKKLLENISALDAYDMKTHGTKFKHMIFSDLKSVGGAKSIGAALISNNFKLIFDNSLDLIDVGKSDKKFAIMCSTKIFDKEIGVRFRRKVFNLFNERPNNVYGENVRFMVLDYGFKEGVDLFDIKYIHVMETPITNADRQQIIGRGTRLCGQKMLNFDKSMGWRLNVYIYKSMIDNDTPMFNLFLKYSNIDITKDTFTCELEKTCIQSSVDFSLNKVIHVYKKPPESYFVKLAKEVDEINSNIPEEKKESVVLYGKRLEKNGIIDCRSGCRDNVMVMPTALLLLAWYTRNPNIYENDYIKEKRPRPILCISLIDDTQFCKHLKEIWADTEGYIISNEAMLRERISKLDKGDSNVSSQIHTINMFINSIVESTVNKSYSPVKTFNYNGQYYFMKNNYANLKWPKINMENGCIDQVDEGKTVLNTELTFNPSQKFLQLYFTPKSAYNGILVWHSTGTGKTCTGISMATNSFDKEDYTIIWVTRNALRGDMWKNMFKQICSISIREKKEPFDLEDALKHPMRYVSKNWLEPITYRQFSNLLAGKNALYEELVKRNGEEDPLKKTLIIIDEAHKLLSSDLLPQEKPDFGTIHTKLQESYNKSKKESVKVILMSATPYTDDPMHLIKLLNLLRPTRSQLPDTYDEFTKKYLNEKGLFKNKLDFMSSISGYISYLNRSGDVRQFAQPIVTDITVPMSKKTKDNLKEIKSEYENIVAKVAELETNKQNLINGAKERKENHRKELALIKNKKDKAAFSKKFKEDEQTINMKMVAPNDKSILEEKQKMKELQKMINTIKEENLNDFSQERILKSKCLTVDLKEN